MMPSRGCVEFTTIRSSGLARAKAATACILGPCNLASATSGGSGQRICSPSGGISKSVGITICTLSLSTWTEAELSTASEIALKPTQQPEKRDIANP